MVLEQFLGAHSDQRDLDFANKYNLKITPVIKPTGVSDDFQINSEAYTGDGILFNSKFLMP